MEFDKLSKLFGKTNQDLELCNQKIQNWTKFLNDYKALEERLSTLADKTRYDVMIPIGGSNLALMNGYIKHSNEILVLLGDNYFVERSAKEAKEMVDRRITKCLKMIEELNKEKDSLEKWLSFSEHFAEETQNKEFVEIVEPFDEEKEKQWREEHKRRVREYKLSQKSQNKVFDSQVLSGLEELEIQENKTQKSELKSILKKTIKSETEGKDKSVVFDDNLVKNEETNKLDTNISNEEISDKAFKNEVKERDVNNEGLESSVEINSSPKVISRFKLSRMNK